MKTEKTSVKSAETTLYIMLEEAKEYWQKGLDELGVTEVELEILGGDTDLSKKMSEYFKSQLEKTLKV